VAGFGGEVVEGGGGATGATNAEAVRTAARVVAHGVSEIGGVMSVTCDGLVLRDELMRGRAPTAHHISRPVAESYC